MGTRWGNKSFPESWRIGLCFRTQYPVRGIILEISIFVFFLVMPHPTRSDQHRSSLQAEFSLHNYKLIMEFSDLAVFPRSIFPKPEEEEEEEEEIWKTRICGEQTSTIATTKSTALSSVPPYFSPFL